MDQKKALEKIKKCLALAKSANENEAAQALKQAQALMREYGISEQDIELAEVVESAGVKSRIKPNEWQIPLAHIVADAFGVRCYLDRDWHTAKIKFYGIGSKPEIAEYAYIVLLRQLKKQRREYMDTVLKAVRLAKNKTYRANQFCLGWVYGVSRKVQVFALGDKEIALLEAFTQSKGFTETQAKSSPASNHAKQKASRDRYLGCMEGERAELNHAMGQVKAPMLDAV